MKHLKVVSLLNKALFVYLFLFWGSKYLSGQSPSIDPIEKQMNREIGIDALLFSSNFFVNENRLPVELLIRYNIKEKNQFRIRLSLVLGKGLVQHRFVNGPPLENVGLFEAKYYETHYADDFIFGPSFGYAFQWKLKPWVFICVGAEAFLNYHLGASTVYEAYCFPANNNEVLTGLRRFVDYEKVKMFSTGILPFIGSKFVLIKKRIGVSIETGIKATYFWGGIPTREESGVTTIKMHSNSFIDIGLLASDIGILYLFNQ